MGNGIKKNWKAELLIKVGPVLGVGAKLDETSLPYKVVKKV